jgi:hypothetical protein
VVGVETRAATRGDGEVIKLDLRITVCPPWDRGGWWRAVWHEDGERQQCEPVSQVKLADRWSRKHADSQRQLCQRFAASVIGGVTCQNIGRPRAEDRQRRAFRPPV